MSVDYKPGEWSVYHEPNDATIATITKAAVSGQTHYITSIAGSIEGAANAAGVEFALYDGATIIWAIKLTNIANTSQGFSLGGLNIRLTPGAAAKLATIETPAASSSATVAMTGYTATT